MKKYIELFTFLLPTLILGQNKLSLDDVYPKIKGSEIQYVISLDSILDIKEIEEFICLKKPDDYIFGYAYLKIDDVDLLINQAKLNSCNDESVPIFCYKEKNVIKINQNSDMFMSVEGELTLNVENFERHLIKRFLSPNEIDAGDPNKTFIDFYISEDNIFDYKNVESKLRIIYKSYFNVINRILLLDSTINYRKDYPLNIFIERPLGEIIKSPPKPPNKK